MSPKHTLVRPALIRRNKIVMLALSAFAACVTQCVLAQASPSLIFAIPAVQGPGTPGYGLVSDPTIQPYLAPGVPAPVGLSFVVDLQGNGRPDAIACHASFPPDPRAKAPCRILRPQSDGTLVDVTRQLLGSAALPSMEHPREFVVGDFNHDGRQDIFVAAHGYDTHPFDGETNVLLISNLDGTYSDRSSTLPQAPDFSHSACAGDVNEDGHLDMYVGNLGSGGVGPYLLIGNGSGTFTRTQSGLPSQIANATETFLSCALVQADGDGFVDLVLGTWSVGGYSDSVVLHGDGQGDFTGRARYVLPRATQGIVTDIAPFDANRDGRPDLFMVTQGSNSSGGGFGLQILMSQTNGTFRDETATRLPNFTPRSDGPFCAFVRFADFNGDGWEDFYCDTNSWNESDPRLWLNSASGTWSPVAPEAMPQQSTAAMMHAVDFEGDGRSDLLRLGYGPPPPSPDIGYRSWLNRTPRTVPSAPIIGTAVAGDARASISFTPPLGSGASPIIGYTATCSPGTVAGVVTGTAAASPIAVTGLTNGRLYSCTVTANSAAGNSLPSSPVNARPAEPFALQASDQYLWLVPPATSTEREGFVRLTNRQNNPASVSVWGLDAVGRRSAGTINLTLAVNESRQFNSSDLERGNVAKGLTGSLGEGLGDWTVIVRSSADIEALAYIRTPDGFLTAMHDRVDGDGIDWFVPIFNPADNPNQVSHLRVVNSNTTPIEMIILGVDDAGATGASAVVLSLPALTAVDLTSRDLENGNAAKGLTGALGNGSGKWHLSLSSTGRVTVQSLLADPVGKLTNLSTLPDLHEVVPGEKMLWLVTPASNSQQQGFVRLINRENRASTLALWGIDDSGRRSPGTITMTLGARESRQLNSQDLEGGNPAKGITGSLGDGTGSWRLVALTDLDLIPLALIRTPDGFLTTMHETLAGNGLTSRVPIFNPAENPNQVSLLRIINPNNGTATVSIRGVDDLGTPAPGGPVSFSVLPGVAIELSAVDLEGGSAPKGLSGSLGNGSGKWALTITSDVPLKVLNLLRDPRGYLTNLSTSARGSDATLNQ